MDGFIGTLWRGWKDIRDLSRSDYLLHAAGDRLSLKQVEFNTILSPFGPLSERAAAMYRCTHVVVPPPMTLTG
ncbi:hypothetical protein M405DRAFT_825341, partial [Rhizopogon salebrosus TDB-379]